jgi:hypothetical protein
MLVPPHQRPTHELCDRLRDAFHHPDNRQQVTRPDAPETPRFVPDAADDLARFPVNRLRADLPQVLPGIRTDTGPITHHLDARSRIPSLPQVETQVTNVPSPRDLMPLFGPPTQFSRDRALIAHQQQQVEVRSTPPLRF